MKVENCPGLQLCTNALPKIQQAFSNQEIRSTQGESLKIGYGLIAANEDNLKLLGINARGLIGRCDGCPIGEYIIIESQQPNLPPPRP